MIILWISEIINTIMLLNLLIWFAWTTTVITMLRIPFRECSLLCIRRCSIKFESQLNRCAKRFRLCRCQFSWGMQWIWWFRRSMSSKGSRNSSLMRGMHARNLIRCLVILRCCRIMVDCTILIIITVKMIILGIQIRKIFLI